MEWPLDSLAGFIKHLTCDYAVILQADRSTLTVDRSLLPADAQVGDFIVQAGPSGHFVVDQEITEKYNLEIRRLSDGYFG
jgi:hypothetical protein